MKQKLNRRGATQVSRVAVVAPMLALTLVAGCSSINEAMQPDKIDYKSQGKKTASLDIPPDLTKLEGDRRYTVPDAAGTSTLSNYQQGVKTREAEPGEGAIYLPVQRFERFERPLQPEPEDAWPAQVREGPRRAGLQQHGLVSRRNRAQRRADRLDPRAIGLPEEFQGQVRAGHVDPAHGQVRPLADRLRLVQRPPRLIPQIDRHEEPQYLTPRPLSPDYWGEGSTNFAQKYCTIPASAT